MLIYSVRVIPNFNIFIPMSFYFIYGYKEKRYIAWTCLNIVALFIVLFALITDMAIFGGRNITRMASSFLLSEEVLESGQKVALYYETNEYSTEYEIRGTKNSNTTRLLEFRQALEKFLEKPILGHGFSLFSLDMQAVMFVARVGMVGSMLWFAMLLFLCRRAYKLERKHGCHTIAVCAFFGTILFDSIFQYVICVVSIMGMVFVLLDLAYLEETVTD